MLSSWTITTTVFSSFQSKMSSNAKSPQRMKLRFTSWTMTMWRTTYDSRSPFYETSKKLLKAFNSTSLPVPIPPPQSPPPWPLETCSCQRRVSPPLLPSHSLDHDSDKANLIIRLDSSLGDFLVPRGHYSIEMYDKYMKLSGPTYTHKVPYPSTFFSHE